MIKRKLKLACSLLAVAGAFCLASCGSTSSANNQPVVNSTDNINEKVETKQKYVIELNMDNYQKYIDVRAEYGYSNGIRYSFYGSLSYGFYDNVVVECERTYSNKLYPYTVNLSVGGYGHYYTSGYGDYKVTGVSGKVIYWI